MRNNDLTIGSEFGAWEIPSDYVGVFGVASRGLGHTSQA